MEANKKIKKNKNIAENIGKNIRYFRKLQGFSLLELASKIGISPQQLQKYETGNNRISAEKLLEVANALKTPLTQLCKPNYEGNFNLILTPDIEKLLEFYSKINSKEVKKLILQNTILFANFGA